MNKVNSYRIAVIEACKTDLIIALIKADFRGMAHGIQSSDLTASLP